MTVILLKSLLLRLGYVYLIKRKKKGLDLAVHGEEGYQLALAPVETGTHITPLETNTGHLRPQMEMPNSGFGYRVQTETGNFPKMETSPLRSQIGLQNTGSRYGVQAEVSDLHQRLQEERLAHLEMGTAELRMRLETETSELRMRLQEERISHLEATNDALRQRLENTTSTNLRAYKQFVVPSSTSSTKNLM